MYFEVPVIILGDTAHLQNRKNSSHIITNSEHFLFFYSSSGELPVPVLVAQAVLKNVVDAKCVIECKIHVHPAVGLVYARVRNNALAVVYAHFLELAILNACRLCTGFNRRITHKIKGTTKAPMATLKKT